MKKEEIYAQWKDHRRQVKIPENFAAGVMAEIKKQVPTREYDLPVEAGMMLSRFTQWAMAAGLVLLGLFRVIYIAGNLLRLNPLIPY